MGQAHFAHWEGGRDIAKEVTNSAPRGVGTAHSEA